MEKQYFKCYKCGAIKELKNFEPSQERQGHSVCKKCSCMVKDSLVKRVVGKNPEKKGKEVKKAVNQ